ncbi:MAG: hypothetical protein KC422_21565 [Trueperaceae bacterium]|nr:hypothetical protein [Trueperaceae bacterium]
MRVSASEFYKRPSYYFDLVAQGTSIEITRHGRVISRLEPPQDQHAEAVEMQPLISGAAKQVQGFVFGAFTYGGVWQGMAPFEKLEQILGITFSIVHWFMNFEQAWSAQMLAQASSKGRTPLISWEAHHVNLAEISAGHYDAYLKTWAVGAQAFAKPVYLRPFPEMNGNWTPWNGAPEDLKAAWRHMVDLFRASGSHNVKWVWCPNITDYPPTPENAMERYFPGDAYVDILALDGYNWGTTKPDTRWQTFETIFVEPYKRIVKLADKPVWITETACAEQSNFDKAAWIRDMFTCLAFPKLEAVIWFNQNKEADWRMDSSSQTLLAFQDNLADLLMAGLAQPNA